MNTLTILCILLSALFGLIAGNYMANYFHDRYLTLKSKKLGRTAVYSQGKFYYIVPEEEYIELDLLRLSRNQSKNLK